MFIVQKAISAKTSIELLKGVLLKARGDKLILTGYDLEIGIETSMESNVYEEGEIVINAKLFGDIIRKLPEEPIEISTDNDNNMYINCKSSKFQLKGESSEAYPKIPVFTNDELINISQDLFKNMIKETVFATSQDATKPILMGELLEIKGDTVSLVAIDGYRLAVRSDKLESPLNDDVNKIVIPGKTLNDIASLISSEGGDIKIGFDDKNVIFIMNEAKVISRLLEGEFIDYTKLLAKEFNLKVKVNTNELRQSIERASLLSLTEKNNLVKFAIRESAIIITSNTEKGNIVEEVNIETEGDSLDIAFNARYILDVLKVIESDEIYMEFTTNVNPCIIKPCSDEDYTYLLLPVRVSNM